MDGVKLGLAWVAFCTPLSASTRTVTIHSESPVGIEQTVLAIGSGSERVRGALVSMVRGDVGGDLPDVRPRVWLDGVEVDVLVITRLRVMQADRSLENGVGLLIAAVNAVRVERRLREFLDDTACYPGSVEYVYSIQLRGMDIKRRSRIEDGRLDLDTRVSGGGLGQLHCARLLITATEVEQQTRIRASLTAHTFVGDRCGLVDRVVGNVMQPLMCDMLRKIERRARELGEAGEPTLMGAAKLFVTEIAGGLR